MKQIISIVFLSVTFLSGQVNIEKQRLSLDKNGVHLSVDYAVTWLSGNSQLFSTQITPSVVLRHGRLTSFLLSDYSRIVSSASSISDKGFMHLRFVYFVRQTWQPEVFVQAEYNKSRLLDGRYLAGGGIRWVPTEHFKAGLSMMEEKEILTDGPTVDTARLSSYVNLQETSTQKRINVNAVSYLQPALTNFHNYRLILEGKISITLSEHFSFFTRVTGRYDSEPYSGLKPWDADIRQGLSIKFQL